MLDNDWSFILPEGLSGLPGAIAKKFMRNIKRVIIGGLLVPFVAVLSGCGKPTQETVRVSEAYAIDAGDFIKGDELIQSIQESPLDEGETNGLLLMREEEKLARDVYRALGEKWGMNVFENIAQSEQTHMDAIKVLLDRYKLGDPVKNDAMGIFTSPMLAQLYKDLVAKGNGSLLGALSVGATIEDLDIKDLNELTAKTDNADIVTTYNNLNKGSRNHLRAYVRQIKNKGGTYAPQYITAEEFNGIISSAQERGRAR
jgi:hypothetical protein